MKFLRGCAAIASLTAMLLISGCNSGSALPDQTEHPTGPVGSIRGFVRLVGDAPKAASDPINQDQKTCGSSVSLPRIALGKDNGVQATFVILEGVPSTGAPPVPVTQSVLIDQ